MKARCDSEGSLIRKLWSVADHHLRSIKSFNGSSVVQWFQSRLLSAMTPAEYQTILRLVDRIPTQAALGYLCFRNMLCIFLRFRYYEREPHPRGGGGVVICFVSPAHMTAATDVEIP